MLKLKDVIYEVTSKCNKHCHYCGSKDILTNENPNYLILDRIASELVNYKVGVVTLSGGEPGCLPTRYLKQIIDKLSDGGIDVRIVTNGTVIKNPPENIDKVSIIGRSINYPEDFDGIMWGGNCWPIQKPKLTMITNFGTHNIFHFDELAEIAKKFNTWQIQLTLGDLLLPPDGIDYLKEKIRNLDSSVKYVLSDNLQDEHKCSAGINSCGITHDGYVIPCLSGRATGNCEKAQGNLMQNSLKDIWENQFKNIRFSENGWEGSCRNCVKYPEIKKSTPTITISPNTSGTIVWPNSGRGIADRIGMYMYAVMDYNVYTYGTTSLDNHSTCSTNSEVK